VGPYARLPESPSMANVNNSGRVRFGVFEVDLNSGELRKQGIKIKLHDQPFRILAMLLERPGEVVTREEITRRLWPTGTFVDSDLGLNSAVMKLRAALGDSADNPRFVETLHRRGYRLIVPVELIRIEKNAGSSIAMAQDIPRPAPTTGQAGVGRPGVNFPDEPHVRAESSWFMRPRSRWLFAAVVLASVIGLGLWRFRRPAPTLHVIAVLPLKNLNPEPGSDYFSDGLTDEIISNLSVIDGLQVKSQTSSFAFKDKAADIHTVANQLGANLILEGSVLREGEKLRLDVQLIRAADDTPLWSGRFDRDIKSVFDVEDEISRAVVNELRLNLGKGRRRYDTNIETYDIYLRARALTAAGPGAGNAASLSLFEDVIARDPGFAPAYAGIADAYAYLSATPRSMSSQVAYPKMKETCQQAIELDPLLAEAYACLGLVDSRNHAWDQAETDFRKAFELNPNLSQPHEDLAMWVLYPKGRLSEAEREIRISMKIDPMSRRILNSLNLLLMSENRFDEVIENCHQILAANPNDPAGRQLYGRALAQEGKLTEAIAVFAKMGTGSESFLGYAYAKSDRRKDAEQILKEHPDWPWAKALINGGLGDKDQALTGLQGMAAMNDPRFGMYTQFPELALLHGDPRLTALRNSVGLP
jgi:TolB-like protein/DNA-binding winged helix-turn-helix (wHTH) protein